MVPILLLVALAAQDVTAAFTSAKIIGHSGASPNTQLWVAAAAAGEETGAKFILADTDTGSDLAITDGCKVTVYFVDDKKVKKLETAACVRSGSNLVGTCAFSGTNKLPSGAQNVLIHLSALTTVELSDSIDFYDGADGVTGSANGAAAALPDNLATKGVACNTATQDGSKIKLEYTPASAAQTTEPVTFLFLPPAGADGFTFSAMTIDTSISADSGGHIFHGPDATFKADTHVDFAATGTAHGKYSIHLIDATTGFSKSAHQVTLYLDLSSATAAKETVIINTTLLETGKYTVFCFAGTGPDMPNTATTELDWTKVASDSAAKGISAIGAILVAMLY